jgi:hypothetical protein
VPLCTFSLPAFSLEFLPSYLLPSCLVEDKMKLWLPALAVIALLAAVAYAVGGAPLVAQRAGADPRSDGASNVRLVGYNDLQGRQALQVTAKSDPANGNWVYVGLTPNDRNDPQASDDAQSNDEPILNPITGKMEYNGTAIVEISDPANPKFVWHIPNEVAHVNSRGVSVVYDYGFNSTPANHDYLIRSFDTGKEFKFQIFDITTRATNPKAIALVSEITGTPPNSCGPGCGGPFKIRAHKGYWSQKSGLYYSASGEPGFRNTLLHIWDLKDPKNPKFVSRVWLPGMKETEDKALYEGQYVHHPIVDEENHRMYIGFRGSGWMGSWDITNPAAPKAVWTYDVSPPYRGPHTITPIVYTTLPNFMGKAVPRTYAFVTDEAGGGADMKPCTSGVRSLSYMFDITAETHPIPVSFWQVPVGNFCEKGGRFGPHQHAETVNGEPNRFEDKLAWIAYFNAGVRVLDLSDPYNLKEVGYYIPKTNKNSHPISKNQPTAIQINDVDIDHRGLGYASDRVGTGLFVFEYTGKKPPVKSSEHGQ